MSYPQWAIDVSVNLSVTTMANSTTVAGLTSNIQMVTGDDLNDSGTTSYDTNRTVLLGIYAEWISSRTFAVRTANIWGNGTGARGNGSYFLNSNPADALTDSVFADSDSDSLTGGLNQDWFFASLGETTDFVGTGATSDRRDG